MPGKKIFFTETAPKPKGPYSQAVIHNNTLYISGQIPVDPDTGILVRGSIEEEGRVVMENIKAIVQAAGAEMEDVVKVTCYLADIDDFTRFNKIYAEYFHHEPPSRTTIQAGRLPMGVQIEVDAIVTLPVKGSK
jgi:2-iminobutanoate/2-iminopropanoate deaminase